MKASLHHRNPIMVPFQAYMSWNAINSVPMEQCFKPLPVHTVDAN